MAKNKFILTRDFVVIEPEPVSDIISKKETNDFKPDINIKERISLNIDKELKIKLQMYCVKNRKKLTEIVENSLIDFLKDK